MAEKQKLTLKLKIYSVIAIVLGLLMAGYIWFSAGQKEELAREALRLQFLEKIFQQTESEK